MQIANLLDADSVLGLVRTSGKQDLLKLMSKRAADLVPVAEREILAALTARESLGSTGMGGGIAVPHARLAGVRRPTGLFAHLHTPIDFEAVDGKPVDLVFLLLLPPTAHGEHLQALASVSRLLRDPAVTKRLRTVSAPSELLSVLTAG